MNHEIARTEMLADPVPLTRIDIPPDRLRDADPDKVAEMEISLRERGQLTNIQLLPPPTSDGNYILNIGLHRLLAARNISMFALRADVFYGSRDEARLNEIDENLYRAELNALDQAVFLAERREIYNRMNGTVVPGRPKKIPANLRQFSFFDDTTTRFGFSRSIIERALTRFNKLTPEVRRALRGTRAARKASEIDALAKLVPFEQFEVAKLLAGPNPPKNVLAALAKVRGAEHRLLHLQKPISERLFALWSKASEAERRAFVDRLKAEGFLHGERVKSIRGNEGKR